MQKRGLAMNPRGERAAVLVAFRFWAKSSGATEIYIGKGRV
jgi:hypothetical protein